MPDYKEETAPPPKPKRVKPVVIERDPEPVSKPKMAEEAFTIEESNEPAAVGARPTGAPKAAVAPEPAGDPVLDIIGDWSEPAKPAEVPKEDGSNILKLNDIMEKMAAQKLEQERAAQFATAAPGGGMPPGPGYGAPQPGFGVPPPGMFHTGMPGGFPPGPGMAPPPGPAPGPGFGGGMPTSGGFNQPSAGFGGGNDLFGGGGAANVFQTAPSAGNYNPGGGPAAFSNEKKEKKKPEGPKEFNDLFSMANKISDRKDQKGSAVDDYVTNYKNNYTGGAPMTEPVDSAFMQPTPPASEPSSDPFGGMEDVFGGSGVADPAPAPAPPPVETPPTSTIPMGAPSADLFGESQPSAPDAFSAPPPNPPAATSDPFGDMTGGSGPTQAPEGEKSKQDELFDIFG